MNDNNNSYKIGQLIDPSEVPNWKRRTPKWQELLDHVMSLTPGQTLTIHFKSKNEAEMARNYVRDNANRIIGSAAVRTRVVHDADKVEITLYFTRLHSSEIVEEKRQVW